MVAARDIGAFALAAALLFGWLGPAVAEKMKALPQDVLDAMDKDDYDKLRELVVPLAEGGGELAQSLLGIMYENGVGVEKDYAKAVYWYIKAGEQGDLRSQVNLGDMYRAGVGTEVDWKQARLWYSRAAEQGQRGPQETYARFLHDTGDEEEAVVWLRKLAPAGSAVATNRWNAIVLPPSPASRPAVCYVESEAARWTISHTPKGQGGSTSCMRMRGVECTCSGQFQQDSGRRSNAKDRWESPLPKRSTAPDL